MKIAILGTGMVGRALAVRLAGLGHTVVIGTRNVEDTLARTEKGAMGVVPYAEWQHANPVIELLTFAKAGCFADFVVNATLGVNSLAALNAVEADNLAGKILLDLAIPLDLSQGLPPTLLISSTDSLGEQIRRAFPDTRVVKSLHTVFVEVMVDPSRVPGPHSMFISGNDTEAKQAVESILLHLAGPRSRSSISVASGAPDQLKCTASSTSISSACSAATSISTSRSSRRDFNQGENDEPTESIASDREPCRLCRADLSTGEAPRELLTGVWQLLPLKSDAANAPHFTGQIVLAMPGPYGSLPRRHHALFPTGGDDGDHVTTGFRHCARFGQNSGLVEFSAPSGPAARLDKAPASITQGR